VYREIREMVLAELDFRREAENLERIAANFNGREDIAFPRVVRDVSTGRVLTTTWMAGIKVQDPQHALAAFRFTLKADPHSASALAGAGQAAFAMGDYPLAQQCLHAALDEAPTDRESATLLEVATEVLRLDPFRRQISDAERDRAVMSLFSTAGDRLQSCPAAGASPTVPGASQNLGDAWNSLKPRVTGRDLRNQDTVNQALNLAFAIERQAAGKCGPGKPADAALLLISKLHEGS